MRLTFSEVRVRAARFADEWKDAFYEKGETQPFYEAFFDIFGVKRRRVASYEERVGLLNDKSGFIDLFWPGVLLVEQKSAGRNLERAYQQALGYCDGLKEGQFPRYVLVSDFQNFELFDLDSRDHSTFSLSQLPENVERFGFIMGVEKRSFRDQDPVNIIASELLGKLHDSLKNNGYDGHKLEQFLVRLLFCLFADDTGIFEPRNHFEDLLKDFTREDGADVGPFLSTVFDILNTPEEKRQKNTPEELNRLPYVNGDLFSEVLPPPAFTSSMRDSLLEISAFHWEKISPAIFGSLFQSVMNAKERRKSGAHYTTEKNIMKVIGPLFMDELRAEFDRLCGLRVGKRQRLRTFHDKISSLKFFDPACGCGNFLVIAYRELRALELDVLKALIEAESGEAQTRVELLDLNQLSRVNVDQFYGIEIAEFPARIAETAMWMMDHIMNNALSQAFGQVYARIPLKKSPTIRQADALEVDWNEVIDSKICSYVFGNPPFIGAKLQSTEQRAQIHRIANLGKSGGTLDYVCGWFVKAGDYINSGTAKGIAFVATNSITQGEQVAQLWPILFDRHKLEISFAHRTFSWGSDARGKAHVHVVIIGLMKRTDVPSSRRLFSYNNVDGEPHASSHKAISANLFDVSNVQDPHLTVREISRPLCDIPKIRIGSKPIDGGHFILSDDQRVDLLREEPQASKWIRPFVGAENFLHNEWRWILALHDISPSELKSLPRVMSRVEKVKDFRLSRDSQQTKDLAATPTVYHVNIVPTEPFLVIPRHTSERREYVPFGWLEPPAIPGDSALVLLEASPMHFAILTSAMHMAWLREIGGRLKSDYRYSAGLVYNNFPWPDLKKRDKERLYQSGEAIIRSREKYPSSTLAELYDAIAMPTELKKAHQMNDRLVDKLYRSQKFASDRERVEHLFQRYERLLTPFLVATKGKRGPKASAKRA
ncbi:MAG: SAM-dependent methyltransferase [Maricaulis sp.]|jgi:hypothetical protein|nr:SAM-dependent methyltransferase [Maricaulis sp.]|tara:strand:- start:378 stop:3194 length:2817 start_codon:yes stop_codon:yes gene_type:complete